MKTTCYVLYQHIYNVQTSAVLPILQRKIKGQRSIKHSTKLGLFSRNIAYMLIISNQCDFPELKNTKHLKVGFIDEKAYLLSFKKKDNNLFCNFNIYKILQLYYYTSSILNRKMYHKINFYLFKLVEMKIKY